MQAASIPLKPLSSLSLTVDEGKILTWMRKAVWEAQASEREPIPYRAKIPEFFSGVRLYNLQGGGAHGPLSLFIKKLEYQGIISKQDLYPVIAAGNARFLALKKTDMDNLGIGQDDDED